jgi:hypothetical protein
MACEGGRLVRDSRGVWSFLTCACAGGGVITATTARATVTTTADRKLLGFHERRITSSLLGMAC